MDTSSLVDLSAAAGIAGALTLVIAQLVKAVTGWEDRKALLATSAVALVLALVSWGATHWQVLADAWQVLTGWLASLATAAGLYGIGKRKDGGGA